MAKALYSSDETSGTKGEAKEVSLWLDRISIAKKEQEQWADDSGAKRFEQEYNGHFDLVFHGRNKKFPVPPINEVFAYVQSDIATTYSRDPYITVNPEAGTTKGAALWEVQLNYYWRKLRTKEELEYEIIDKDLVGYSWHKVGTDPKTGKMFSKYLDWKDVLWNVGAKRPPNDCSWMAQRIVRPITQIKKMFPSSKGLEGVPNPDVKDETFKKSSYKDDIKVGIMWEVWDMEKQERVLLAEGLKDKFLAPKRPWPEYMSEFPFLMYWDFARPGKSRPMSAIAPWESQLLAKMILMASALNHAKRWNRQAFVKNGSIDENALDKFERGDDGAIITFNGDTADLKFADFGQLPTDFYLIMDRLDAIKRNVNGQPEFVQGGVTKTGTRTIGELNKMEEGVRGRQDRKIDRLETHCENIARHMMAELKGNFDFDATLKITGDTPEKLIEALGSNYDPETQTVKFTAEDIEGEYDVDVKAGSTLPLNKQNRQQILEMILNTLATVTAQGPVSPFLNTLITMLLKDYEIKGLEEAYEQQEAQVQEAKQLENSKASIEDQKTAAEAAKRMAQAKQIEADAAVSAQDAQMGPVGRSQLRKNEKPDPHVSESISFKDLPPDGKVQLAAQAGLPIATPPREIPPNGTPKK